MGLCNVVSGPRLSFISVENTLPDFGIVLFYSKLLEFSKKCAPKLYPWVSICILLGWPRAPSMLSWAPLMVFSEPPNALLSPPNVIQLSVLDDLFGLPQLSCSNFQFSSLLASRSWTDIALNHGENNVPDPTMHSPGSEKSSHYKGFPGAPFPANLVVIWDDF